MNDKIISGNARFKTKSDTLANWERENPVLLAGEPTVVIDGTDTKKIKFGDGVTPWNDLPYWKGSQEILIEDLLGEDIEIIFDGGDASTDVKVIVIDKEMSDTSENPIANSVVKKYVDENKTVTDTEMSDTSNNPIANSTVKEYVDNKILPVADYIIEQGKSGDWTYRKWSSGIAECWTASCSIISPINTAWGALYISDIAFPQLDYPENITFLNAPICNFDLGYVFVYGKNVGYCFANNADDTSLYRHTPKIYAWSPIQITKDVNITARITVIGKWK